MINSESLQRDYLQPASQRARQFSRAYPVISIFAAIFSVLSLLPIAGFLVISVLTLSFFLVTAFLVAVTAGAAVVIGLGMALFAFLLLASLFSLFLTAGAICAYLSYRLFTLLQSEDTLVKGFSVWFGELRAHIVSRVPKGSNPKRTSGANGTGKPASSPNGIWANGQGRVVVADEATLKREGY